MMQMDSSIICSCEYIQVEVEDVKIETRKIELQNAIYPKNNQINKMYSKSNLWMHMKMSMTINWI